MPNNTEIANVLINAAPNITTFNISTDSVVVSDPGKHYLILSYFEFIIYQNCLLKQHFVSLTTATPTTTTTAATTITATPTTTKAVTTTTAETVQKREVQFRSVNGIFTTDLLTSSSRAFKERASLIETAVSFLLAVK